MTNPDKEPDLCKKEIHSFIKNDFKILLRPNLIKKISVLTNNIKTALHLKLVHQQRHYFKNFIAYFVLTLFIMVFLWMLGLWQKYPKIKLLTETEASQRDDFVKNYSIVNINVKDSNIKSTLSYKKNNVLGVQLIYSFWTSTLYVL